MITNRLPQKKRQRAKKVEMAFIIALVGCVNIQAHSEIIEKSEISSQPLAGQIMPIQIFTLVEKEHQYLISGIKEIISTLKGEIPLQEISKIFGEGHYHWPKMPKKPVLSFLSGTSIPSEGIPEEFKYLDFRVNYERRAENSLWFKGYFSINPKGYTKINTNFTESFLTNDLGLEFIEQRVNSIGTPPFYHSVRTYGEYRYYLRSDKNIKVVFYVHQDDYHPQDTFPQNFTRGMITRED